MANYRYYTLVQTDKFSVDLFFPLFRKLAREHNLNPYFQGYSVELWTTSLKRIEAFLEELSQALRDYTDDDGFPALREAITLAETTRYANSGGPTRIKHKL